MADSEVIRYVRYLQKSLTSEVLPEAHDQVKLAEWTRTNLSRLQEISSSYSHSLSKQEIFDFSETISAYCPETEFQTAGSAMIFEPLIEEISSIASALGIGLSKEIIFANLPDVGIGPLSRPSTETPMIFAGVGTSAFCNYWSKFYSTFFVSSKEMEPHGGDSSSPLETLGNVLKPVAEAAMLSIYYSYSGTVLGYNTVREPAIAYSYRIELLRAMEIFVLAHEYAHLYLEEKYPDIQGCLDPEEIGRLELECDKIGFALARNYGAKYDNWSAFSGAGAFLYFEAVKTCYFARKTRALREPEPDGHPSPEQRQQRLLLFAIESANQEQKEKVEYYLNDLQSVSNCFSSLVGSGIEKALMCGP